MAGLFITFEGGEGAGKSTQVRLLADRIRSTGREIVATREPGGTPEAEAIRALLVSGPVGRWTATAETLLNYAARDSHLTGLIRPALARGAIVLSDRFMDSTRAYQGHAGGASLSLIDGLEAEVVATTRPNLTLILDLDPQAGLDRAGVRVGEDRYERKGLAFHRRLRDGFLAIARGDPRRCRVIDASGDVATVAASVWAEFGGIVDRG
jgi:dTMP kinase